MKFLPFFSSPRQAFAPGFPKVTSVRAKRLKSESVLLVNGTNSFTMLTADKYSAVRVEGVDGIFKLIGAMGSELKELATFGSEAAAANAHEALMRASAGRSLVAGRPWLLRTVLLVGGIWVVLSTISAGLASRVPALPTNVGLQDSSPTIQSDQGSTQRSLQAGSGSAATSLEQLANGGYTFQPKIEMPQIQAPGLNCPPFKG